MKGTVQIAWALTLFNITSYHFHILLTGCLGP